MAIVTIDGQRVNALISCHRDHSFTFHHNGQWHERQRTVPRAVLNELPADERSRVMRRLAEAGEFPS